MNEVAPVLQVDDISLSFKGVKAITNVSFEVADGELFAIIGPNGAGKTSIFNSISQVYRPQEGDISWKGESIMGSRPDRVAELGIARTFQNIELFPHMTVLENILLGRHVRMERSWLAGSLWFGAARREEMEHRLAVEDIIDFLEIEDMARFILDIRQELGISMILVEHDMGLVMDIADRVMVLDFGEMIATGPPVEVQRDPAVIAAYLGDEAGFTAAVD